MSAQHPQPSRLALVALAALGGCWAELDEAAPPALSGTFANGAFALHATPVDAYYAELVLVGEQQHILATEFAFDQDFAELVVDDDCILTIARLDDDLLDLQQAGTCAILGLQAGSIDGRFAAR